jgi:hypothetical protein
MKSIAQRRDEGVSFMEITAVVKRVLAEYPEDKLTALEFGYPLEVIYKWNASWTPAMIREHMERLCMQVRTRHP